MKGVRRRPSFSPTPMIIGRREALRVIDNIGHRRGKRRNKVAQTPFKVPIRTVGVSYQAEIFDHLYSRQTLPETLSEIFQSGVTAPMRSKIIEWIFMTCNKYQVSRSSIFAAVSILDRSLCTLRSDEDKFQLMGATALFIAVKMFNTNAFSLQSLHEECAGAYSIQDFICCEAEILSAINYDVSTPSVVDFLELHESALGSFKSLKNLMWFIADLHLQFSSFLRFKASTIACAVLFVAIHALGEPISQPILSKLVTNEDWKDLYYCIEELTRVIMALIGKTKTSILEKINPEEYRKMKQLIDVPSLPSIEEYLLLFPNVDLE